jgi:hypothetical protein
VASLVCIAADPGTRDLAAFGYMLRRVGSAWTGQGPSWPCPWTAREFHGGIVVFVRKASCREYFFITPTVISSLVLVIGADLFWLDAHVGWRTGEVLLSLACMLRPAGRHSPWLLIELVGHASRTLLTAGVAWRGVLTHTSEDYSVTTDKELLLIIS